MNFNFVIIKRMLACVLVLLATLNFTPFTPAMVANWVAGSEYCKAMPDEKADMLLDLYVNQAFIYLDEAATDVTRTVLREMLIEVISSEGNSASVIAALNSMPVYDYGNVTPGHKDFVPIQSDIKKLKMPLDKLIDASALPDETKLIYKNCTGGINDLRIYFLSTKYDGVYEFAGDFVQDDGTVVIGNTGVFYDSNTTMIYGVANNGILEIGFDLRVDDLTLTNPINPWQRRYGFNVLYDIVGNMSIINTNTVRVRFNNNGENLMIQFWKGNYSRVSNGAEIGIYTRNEKCPILYDCVTDDAMLYMSLKLYHGDELISRNDRQKHWWLSAYQPGALLDPDELTLDGTIEFTDRVMFDSFMAAAKDAFKNKAEITSTGLTVHIIW